MQEISGKKYPKNKRIINKNKTKVINLKKKNIVNLVKIIFDTILKLYGDLKEEEHRIYALTEKLELEGFKIDEISIDTPQIKINKENFINKLQHVNDYKKLNSMESEIQNIKTLINIDEIKEEYYKVLKLTFEKSFDEKVQDLIKNSKLSKLEKLKQIIEEEKINFIGKILGKGKLKQVRLENIDLKKQLINTETQRDKTSYSLEESLSDLHVYSQYESDGTITKLTDLIYFVKTDEEMRSMINQKKLTQFFKEKSDSRYGDVNLLPVDKNGKISIKYETNMIKLQNYEINRQIQNNRAKTVKMQNSFLNNTNIEENHLEKFQNMIDKINLSLNNTL